MKALRLTAALSSWWVLVGAAGGVIEPEGVGCPEASVTAELTSASQAGDTLQVRGRISSAGTTTGALVEYRVDSDRYRSEILQIREGPIESAFPFKLCGDHVAQLWIYPLVTDGGRQAVCLGRSAQVKATFNSPCGAEALFDSCEWRCDQAKNCNGTCQVSVHGEAGSFLLMSSVAESPFRPVGPAGPGPFKLALSCRAGAEITVRARGAGSKSFSGAAKHVCGEP